MEKNKISIASKEKTIPIASLSHDCDIILKYPFLFREIFSTKEFAQISTLEIQYKPVIMDKNYGSINFIIRDSRKADEQDGIILDLTLTTEVYQHFTAIDFPIISRDDPHLPIIRIETKIVGLEDNAIVGYMKIKPRFKYLDVMGKVPQFKIRFRITDPLERGNHTCKQEISKGGSGIVTWVERISEEIRSGIVRVR